MSSWVTLIFNQVVHDRQPESTWILSKETRKREVEFTCNSEAELKHKNLVLVLGLKLDPKDPFCCHNCSPSRPQIVRSRSSSASPPTSLK